MDNYKRLCEEQANKWTCSDCTTMNKPDLTSCAACNVDRVKTNSDSKSSYEDLFTKNIKNEVSGKKVGESENGIANLFQFFPKSTENGEKDEKMSEDNENGLKSEKIAEVSENLKKSPDYEKIPKDGSAIVVFGNNGFGSLGLGPASDSVVEAPLLQPASLGHDFVFIASGSMSMAAVDSGGNLWTWGPVHFC